MTVRNLPAHADYAGNDAATEFPVTFDFLDPDHLHVYAVVGETETELTADSDYTIDGATVTVAVPVPTGTTLSIRRVTPIEQLVDLRTQGDYAPDTLERMSDALTMVAQEHREGAIDASTIITGEVAGAANVGTVGVGVYESLLSKILRLRNIAAADAKIAVTLDAAAHAIMVGLGTVTAADVGAAPASHVGSTSTTAGHPPAANDKPGFMAAAEHVKLAGIEAGANLYVHPATHSPAIIAQDASNRFVTDGQIGNWNIAVAHSAINPGNPHGTTPALIGAATQASVDTLTANVASHALTIGDHETRLDALEPRVTALEEAAPWKGAYSWTGSRWDGAGCVGLDPLGSRTGTGICEVLFASPLMYTDYRVEITCGFDGTKFSLANVVKYQDRVEVHLSKSSDWVHVDDVDFDIVVYP